jgi:hypothetical protein
MQGMLFLETYRYNEWTVKKSYIYSCFVSFSADALIIRELTPFAEL